MRFFPISCHYLHSLTENWIFAGPRNLRKVELPYGCGAATAWLKAHYPLIEVTSSYGRSWTSYSPNKSKACLPFFHSSQCLLFTAVGFSHILFFGLEGNHLSCNGRSFLVTLLFCQLDMFFLFSDDRSCYSVFGINPFPISSRVIALHGEWACRSIWTDPTCLIFLSNKAYLLVYTLSCSQGSREIASACHQRLV